MSLCEKQGQYCAPDVYVGQVAVHSEVGYAGQTGLETDMVWV